MRRDVTLQALWPEHLIAQVARGNFLLVVGAGVSASCQNNVGNSPPNWRGLLDLLIKAQGRDKYAAAAKEALAKDEFLDCAEILRTGARSKGKETDFVQAISEATDGGIRAEDQYKPRSLHDDLMRLDPGVIVTTNYDKILERATSNGFKVHRYEDTSTGSELRSGAPVLIKLHGSVDNSQGLVLTRSDFTRLRKDGAHSLEVVQALFLTRPALFLGYSFNDPDIQLLLENVLGGQGDTASHYMLTGSDIPDHRSEIYKYCYGTSVIKHVAGDYSEMARMVALLADAVEDRRVLIAG